MSFLNSILMLCTLVIGFYLNGAFASNYLYEVKQFKSFSTGGSFVIEGNYCLANQCEYKKLRLATDAEIYLLKDDNEHVMKYSEIDWSKFDRVEVYVNQSVIVRVVLSI